MDSNTTLNFKGQSTMGLRIPDSRSYVSAASSQKTEGENVVKLSVSSPVSLLNCSTNNDKHYDQDETSSGYSSRESHCGALEQAQSRRPQRSSKNSISSKETTKNLLMESVAEKSLQDFEQISENDNYQKASCFQSSPNKCELKKVIRQSRVDYSDNTPVTDESSQTSNFTEQEQGYEHRKFVEIEVQTDPYESDILQALQMSNDGLRNKLNVTNFHFEGLVEQLESQLLTAMTEIARLKAQLLMVNKQGLKAVPCTKCGFMIQSDKVSPEMRSKARSTPPNTLRKSSSIGNLSQKQSLSSPSVTAVKLILKGQDPYAMKLALLQRNKTLRDEIENLKTSQPLPRASSTSSLLSTKLPRPPSSRTSNVSYDKYDLAMDQIITNESEALSRRKANHRSTHEEVRWKQHDHSSRKQAKNSGVHSQSTSRAFRTINVKTWAPTT